MATSLFKKIIPKRFKDRLRNALFNLIKPRIDDYFKRNFHSYLKTNFPGYLKNNFYIFRKHLIRDRRLQEQLKARLESIDLEEELFGDAPRCQTKTEFMSLAVDYAMRFGGDGLWLEFGVYKGGSINMIAGKTDKIIYGFDSFSGLPEQWQKGRYDTAEAGKRDMHGELPVVRDNARLVKGLFQDTLADFLKEHPEPVSFVHIDCDLYSSAKFVLDHLKFKDDSVIVFNEYYNYTNWREGEYKAFQEFLRKRRARAECIAFCPSLEHAAFVLHFSNANKDRELNIEDSVGDKVTEK